MTQERYSSGLRINQTQNWSCFVANLTNSINKTNITWHVTLLSNTNVPVRFWAQQHAKYSPPQLTVANCIAAISCLGYYVKLIWRITNHRRDNFPPSLTLLSFKTRIELTSVLNVTTSFPTVFCQILHAVLKTTSKLFGSQGCSDDKNCIDFSRFFFLDLWISK